ncbi:MAG TPA: aldo/keto reductase [Methylomirabilota bacterium]
MQNRKLGHSGLMVSEIGFGTWAIGGDAWGPSDDSAARRALLRAFDLGVNFVDTALSYGWGHSERLVGHAVREAGGGIRVATKIPPRPRRWLPRTSMQVRTAFPRDWIVQATESSLRNLGTESIHLQQLHTWRDEWLDEPDWQEAIGQLKAQGKIQAFGISLLNHRPDSALRAVASGLVDSVQLIFNVFYQSAREVLFDHCRLHNVGIIVRSPFDESSLTGRLTPETRFPAGDFRREYFRGERLRETCRHVEGFRAEAVKQGESLARLALRFCLSHEAVSTVIPGMRNPKQVDENCTVSSEWLTPEQLSALRDHAWPRNYYKMPMSRRLWWHVRQRLR